MLAGRERLCERLTLPGSVVGDYFHRMRHLLGRWTDQLLESHLPTCRSVSSVEIHGAGAPTPALSEITASPSLPEKQNNTDAEDTASEVNEG